MTARLSAEKSTGNAIRDYRNEPIVFPSNVIIEYGEKRSLNKSIEEIDKGVMARGIIGAYSSDYISGDFSVTLDECSLVKNGKVKRVENVSIGGNTFGLLTSIECVSKEVVQYGVLYYISLVLFVYLSAYGSSPLNLFLKGESSTGKTYLAKNVAEYFPEEDVWFIGDMSPKALIHEHGTFEEGKMHVSLQNKILVFLETPRKETLEMLKPILSHDRREIEYKITDRSRSGALQTKNVIIEGWPATIFCSTDFRILDELSTRSLLTTPEISEEKIEKVLEYKGIKYSRPWEQMEEDESEVIFKNALKLLKSEREVCVPYADELAQRYTRSEPRVMRDFDKLMELIKMSAFLHQEQRPAFELKINGASTHFIVANEFDYRIGMHLFDHIRETTVTGLPQTIIDFYERIICQLNDITYSSMMKKFKSVYGKLIGRDQIRKRYVDPLEAVGWLNRGKDAVDGRIVTFEKCIDEDENPGKTRLSTSLVLKDIFPEDRLKEYLEEVEKNA